MMDSHRSPGEASDGREDPPPVISSRELLGRHREIVITHGDAQYRLRLTSNDKLILFK